MVALALLPLEGLHGIDPCGSNDVSRCKHSTVHGAYMKTTQHYTKLLSQLQIRLAFVGPSLISHHFC